MESSTIDSETKTIDLNQNISNDSEAKINKICEHSVHETVVDKKVSVVSGQEESIHEADEDDGVVTEDEEFDFDSSDLEESDHDETHSVSAASSRTENDSSDNTTVQEVLEDGTESPDCIRLSSTPVKTECEPEAEQLTPSIIEMSLGNQRDMTDACVKHLAAAPASEESLVSNQSQSGEDEEEAIFHFLGKANEIVGFTVN